MSLFRQSATALRDLIDRREVSCLEVIDAFIARAEATQAAVGGFAIPRFDAARREARRQDDDPRGGPLRGLPLSIKENLDLAGSPSSLGIAGQRRIAEADAVVVAVARAAGAIVLGKSNVPQGLLSSNDCHNPLYGETRNPWRTTHGPGGSSGGEGALLASGASVLGIGSDLGGSARFPAIYCGVVGLVPTPGRFARTGMMSLLAGQDIIQAQPGPMARTIDDLWLLMSALDGPAQHRLDPVVPPLPLVAYAGPADAPLTGLRVGVFDDDGLLTPSAACRRAVKTTADALADAGATTVPFAIDDQARLMAFYLAAVGSDGGATVRARLGGERLSPSSKTAAQVARVPDRLMRAVPRVLGLAGETRLADVARRIGRRTVEGYWALTHERDRLRQASHAAWRAAGIDLLLGPPAATPAIPIGGAGPISGLFAYTARANIMGRPAGVVPVTAVRADEADRPLPERPDRIDRTLRAIDARSRGLPVSVQVMGRPWAEATVIAALRVIEAAGDAPPTPVDPTSVAAGVSG